MSNSELEDVAHRVAGLEDQGRRMTRLLELLTERSATPAVRTGRNWDGYVAAIATVVGLLALVVSAYTAYVQRQQLRAQVWPFLRIADSDVPPDVGFHVTNTGNGVARVTAVRVTVDSKPVPSWEDGQEAMASVSGGVVYRRISDTVIAAGQDLTILRPYNDELIARFEELFLGRKHKIVVTICYCSVLEECWVATLGARASRDPEACPITEAERFTQ